MGAHLETTVAALTRALVEEERILAHVIGVLFQQREALARDDLAALDDSIFATRRLLLTLGEARRRRVALNHMLGEADDLSMRALDDAFGGAPPPAVETAMRALGSTDIALRREVDLNQRVLRLAGGTVPSPVRAPVSARTTPRGGTSRAMEG